MNGATIFSITTFSQKAFSILGLFATLSINDIQHYGECYYAECRNCLNITLSVIMLNVIMLSVVRLNVVLLNVFRLNVVMLSVVAPLNVLSELSNDSDSTSNIETFVQQHFLFAQLNGSGKHSSLL